MNYIRYKTFRSLRYGRRLRIGPFESNFVSYGIIYAASNVEPASDSRRNYVTTARVVNRAKLLVIYRG